MFTLRRLYGVTALETRIKKPSSRHSATSAAATILVTAQARAFRGGYDEYDCFEFDHQFR
ncbi:hypothetical protein SBC1_28090 [Caballeronia sp. SBC1]|nr:hypothetical protein SBC1_28090 [Caballeronia sp. SBC1]